MKILVALLFCLPLLSSAQTIHRKGNKIVYEGEVALSGSNTSQINTALQKLLSEMIKKEKDPATVQKSEHGYFANGDLKLSASYPVSRSVNYTIELKPKEGGYKYKIDSVYVTEKKPGETERKRTGKELLKEMEVSGPVSEAAEKILNEIDMNFQRLLAVLKTKMQKDVAAAH